MDIRIKATKMEMTKAIESAVKEKVGSLEKYFDKIISIDVEVGKTAKHHHKGDFFRAEINVQVPKKMLRAEAETDDLYKSINEVRDRIKLEITKYKETHQQD